MNVTINLDEFYLVNKGLFRYIPGSISKQWPVSFDRPPNETILILASN